MPCINLSKYWTSMQNLWAKRERVNGNDMTEFFSLVFNPNQLETIKPRLLPLKRQ